MLVRFFSAGNPIIFVALFILTAALLMIDAVALGFSMPEQTLDHAIIEVNYWLGFILNVIIYSISAIQITILAKKYDLYKMIGWLPALIFILIITIPQSASVFNFHTLALLPYLLAIRMLMGLFSANNIAYSSFLAGFWIGVVLIVDPELIGLVLAAMIAFFIHQINDWKNYLILLIGIIFPLLILFAVLYAFYLDEYFQWVINHISVQIGVPFNMNVKNILPYIILIIASFKGYGKQISGSTVKTRKATSVWFWISIITSLLAIAFQWNFYWALSIMLAGVSLILTPLFESRENWKNELLVWLLIFGSGLKLFL